MKLGQTQSQTLNTNLLADSQQDGSKSPCEKANTDQTESFFDKATGWAKANKSWLPWAVAGGATLMLLRGRK